MGRGGIELASREISGEQGGLQLSPMIEVDDELEKIRGRGKGIFLQLGRSRWAVEVASIGLSWNSVG